jgi:hypothetical protein
VGIAQIAEEAMEELRADNVHSTGTPRRSAYGLAPGSSGLRMVNCELVEKRKM